jgi:uncharacterized membrane protein
MPPAPAHVIGDTADRPTGSSGAHARIGGVEASGTNRLEMFSDGVFAIAATLLVLEIAVNTGRFAPALSHQLLHLWPSYLAYTTSFLTIGIIWINHHAVMEQIARVDRTFLFLNTVFVLVVAFIPFPTRLVADFLQAPGERAAVVMYGATILLMTLVFNLLWTYARKNRRLIRTSVPESTIRAITQAFYVGIPLNSLVILLAIWTPLGGMILAFSITAFYLPGVTLLNRS